MKTMIMFLNPFVSIKQITHTPNTAVRICKS